MGPGGSALAAATGRDSSRDEQGACALLSTQLNTLLGERPVTHREVQGNESDVFMEYFPRGVTYQVWVLGVPDRCLGCSRCSASQMGAQHPDQTLSNPVSLSAFWMGAQHHH